MPSGFLRSFARDESAVVAATYALMLVPIVGLAGVGYDFAQMAALDTEVQNAADHAALAAATQLDGTAGAMDNATSAASNLLTNLTMMAADGKAAPLAITSVVFYDSNSNAENDTGSFTDTSKSPTAKYVKVTIETRKARFALTPIVGVLWSPDLGAGATAGLGSALCRVPPVMMCNPAEATDVGFNNDYVGDGIELVSVGGGGGAWAPGNFGYLDVNAGDSGNPLIALKKALGWDSPPGDCLPETGVSTKPGANTPVTEALNTRFDIFDSTGPGGGSCPTGGNCSASINTTKDLIHKPNVNKFDCCGTGKGWQLPTTEYQPVSLTNAGPTPTSMGHPRDICHSLASPNCASYSGNSHIGNGNWDRATYFQVNYPGLNWQSALGTSTPTRYQVYRWEITHRNDTYGASGATIGGNRIAEGSGANASRDYNQPVSPHTGINPDDGGVDRRTFPVAVVNCTANSVNGNSTGVQVLKWMNMFLVEPSTNRARTSQQDVYVEVVSVNDVGNNDGGAAAVIRRDKPYLIK